MKKQGHKCLENRTGCVRAPFPLVRGLRLPREERAPRLSAGRSDIER